MTFSLFYAFWENFVLPISHDEVVHGKGSLRDKMPGDYDGRVAGLRASGLYDGPPGKKLLFMGSELPQWHEWDFRGQLDWYLLDDPACRASHQCLRQLNRLYKRNRCLWENDRDWDGFTWLVADDNHNNVLVFLRRDRRGHELICAVNFAPVPGTTTASACRQRRGTRYCSTRTTPAGAAAAAPFRRAVGSTWTRSPPTGGNSPFPDHSALGRGAAAPGGKTPPEKTERRRYARMKKECVAMLLAGGQGSRLYVLTGKMAKPAVPFGGKFRIIDFPLSNCTNSGIDTVGVLTQYRPLELNGYIGNGQPWNLDRPTAASISCRPIRVRRRRLVQGYRQRHLSEHRLRGSVRPGVRADPLRRPHL